MAEQMAFEGLEIQQERIKLKAAWVAGLGLLHIGDKVRVEGIARCVGVGFEKDPKTGEGIRIHMIAAEEITATEVVTDDTLAGLGN